MVDSLDSGGAEHIAVMLANNLPQDRYRAYLCASRQAGSLKSCIQDHVVFYDLQRKGRFDIFAVCRFMNIIRREQIHIIHTHTTSLFLGVMLCILDPNLRLVWHDHFGLHELKPRSVYLYRLFAHRAAAIFTVTQKLANWAVRVLGISQDKVIYLPNFIDSKQTPAFPIELPGKTGKRIVCVANIRPQKDHLTLIRALSQVVQVEPKAHLILVGAETDSQLAERARDEVRRLGLEPNLTWLGSRQDVPLILMHCDIGVLSSVSEGFPVTLLEYGRAGLSVVATRVGECAEILEDGSAGLLVPPGDPDALATSILQLLANSSLRIRLGERLANRVKWEYSVETIINRVCEVYESIL